MLRAALADISRIGTKRRPEGASTITQQVAKNFLLSNEVSFERKIKEALIAIRMEQVLSKDRILELYLNEIYLGGGVLRRRGGGASLLQQVARRADASSRRRSSRPCRRAPTTTIPQRNPEAARERRDWVIDRMVEADFISAAQGAAAKAQPIELRRRDQLETVSAPYFTEEVRRELLGALWRQGALRGRAVGAHQPRSTAPGASPTMRCATR